MPGRNPTAEFALLRDASDGLRGGSGGGLTMRAEARCGEAGALAGTIAM